MSRGRILIVEDSESGALLLSEVFKAEGFEPIVRSDVASGVASAEEIAPQAVIIDWQLPDGSGLELCRRIRQRDPMIPIIMVTGRSDEASAIRALDAGADDFVTKPLC
jgi:two-component system alkaline phosphatase synthesis response regulator PhoP